MISVSCGLRFDLLDLCVIFLCRNPPLKFTIKKLSKSQIFFTYLEDPGIYIYIIFLYVLMIIMMIIIIILNIYIYLSCMYTLPYDCHIFHLLPACILRIPPVIHTGAWLIFYKRRVAMDWTCGKQLACQISGDSGMYPYQCTPTGNPYISPIYPYNSWVFMGEIIPKNPYIFAL